MLQSHEYRFIDRLKTECIFIECIITRKCLERKESLYKMSIILKYIKGSLKHKKLQTSIILLSIIICSALVMCSMTLINSILEKVRQQAYSEVGNSDICIEIKQTYQKPLDTSYLGDYADEMEFVASVVSKNMVCQVNDSNAIFNLNGMTGESIASLKYYEPLEGTKDLSGFDSNDIIIGKATADKFNLKPGDKIKIVSKNLDKELVVYGISKNNGKFRNMGFYEFAIVSSDIYEEMLHYSENDATQVYIKLNDIEKKEQMIDKLQTSYPDCYVDETISEEEISRDIGSVTLSFYLIIAVVIVMSFVIIYSTSKVLMLERTCVFGSFRSIGASIKKIRYAILLEYFSYAIIGALGGILLGIGLFYVLANVISWSELAGETPNFIINVSYIALVFAVAIAESLFSAALAIKKIINSSIIGLIKNKNINRTAKPGIIKLICGILILTSAYLMTLCPYDIEGLSEMLGMLAVAFGIVGSIMLSSCLVTLVTFVLKKALNVILNNDVYIALCNLKNDVYMKKNISLLAISISGLLLVGTIGFSILNSTEDFFSKDVKFDIWFKGTTMDEAVIEKLGEMDGVDEVFGSVEYYDAEVVDKNFKVDRILGVDSNKKVFEYLDMHIEGDVGEVLTGRNAMVSIYVRDHLGLEIGSTIKVKIESNVCEYKVVGFFDTVLDAGSVIMVSAENLKEDLNNENYRYAYIKTDENEDASIIAQKMQDEFADLYPSVLTTEELQEQQIGNNIDLMSLLKVFVIICSITCFLGVSNNMFTSCIARQKRNALWRSIGMSINKNKKIFMIEALICGIMGCVGSGIATITTVYVMPYFYKTVSAPPISAEFPMFYFVLNSVMGIFITLLASWIMLKKTMETNIIEILKKEV